MLRHPGHPGEGAIPAEPMERHSHKLSLKSTRNSCQGKQGLAGLRRHFPRGHCHRPDHGAGHPGGLSAVAAAVRPAPGSQPLTPRGSARCCPCFLLDTLLSSPGSLLAMGGDWPPAVRTPPSPGPHAHPSHTCHWGSRGPCCPPRPDLRATVASHNLPSWYKEDCNSLAELDAESLVQREQRQQPERRLSPAMADTCPAATCAPARASSPLRERGVKSPEAPSTLSTRPCALPRVEASMNENPWAWLTSGSMYPTLRQRPSMAPAPSLSVSLLQQSPRKAEADCLY